MFNPENAFWQGISKFTDVLVLSLLWLFCSLPLFTIGAATAALYDAAVKCVRGGESGPWGRFLRTFRREFAVGSITTVIWGVLLGALVWVLRLLWRAILANVAGAQVAAAGLLVILLIPAGAGCWMFPLLSRFTFRPGGLMLTGLRLALGYLPYTVIIVAATALAVLASGFLLLPMLLLPCLTVLLWSLMMERAFRKYMPQEDSEPDCQEEL